MIIICSTCNHIDTIGAKGDNLLRTCPGCGELGSLNKVEYTVPQDGILYLGYGEPDAELKSAGVYDPPAVIKAAIQGLLTFKRMPKRATLMYRASDLADIANAVAPERGYVLVDAWPYMLPQLERDLKSRGLVPLYEYKRKVTREETLPNGEVTLVDSYIHEGFVEAI